jgi:hypothetical protein
MIANDAETIRGRQTCEIGFWFVGVKVERAGKRRIQDAFGPVSGQSSVFSKSLSVEQNQGPAVDPLRRFHFANARKVSRYFAINSRPWLSCLSTSGAYAVSR